MSGPVDGWGQFLAFLNERDRRYEQRFADVERATTLALHAAEKQTVISFEAASKAVEKAEAAQKAYNERSNEFRQALDDSNREKIGRAEFDTRFHATDEKLEARTIALSERMELADKNILIRVDVLAERVAALEKIVSQSAGTLRGSAQTVTYLVLALGALATIVSLFTFFSR